MVGGTACALVCYVIPPACALGLPRVPRCVAPDGHVTYYEPLFPWCSATAAAALALALAYVPPPRPLLSCSDAHAVAEGSRLRIGNGPRFGTGPRLRKDLRLGKGPKLETGPS